MTSDLCAEDVVVQISQPQIVSHAVGPSVVTASARVHATSAAVELGRRLLQAARAGDTPLVRHLMAKGAPFTTDWLGTSPLHLAAWGGHLSTCGVLVRAGVSRDARTKVDRTPLHLAAHAGHAAVAALLLDHGASPHARDMLQMTPLHWAAERGHAACAAVLCAAGADLHAACKFRRTPRSLAATRGHDHVLRVLDDAAAQRAAAADQTNKEGETQLKTDPAQEIHQEIPVKQEQKFQNIKIENPKERVSPNDRDGAGDVGGAGAGGGAGAALLRRHGITLLADEPPATVLSALHSGRTLVLSDAGKLMLKESECAAGSGGGVVVRARAVRGAARGGKTFLLSVGNKLVPERGAHQMKRCRGGAAGGSGAGVRIVVNRAQLSRLAPGVPRVPDVPAAPDVPGPPNAPDARRLPDVPGVPGGQQSGEEAEESDNATLRAQLASAHAALRTVLAQLEACRARLQRYEPL